MLVSVFRFILAALGGYVGFWLEARFTYHLAPFSAPFNDFINLVIYLVLGSAVGYVLGGVFGRQSLEFSAWVEGAAARTSAGGIFAGSLGMTVGLLAGALLYVPLSGLQPMGPFASIFISIVAAYLGLRVGIRRAADISALFGLKTPVAGAVVTDKILDTSSIIDGRILEVAKSHFLEGTIIVPRFILDELQRVADSTDSIKRSRGRRGLEVLKSLQDIEGVSVEIHDVDFPELREVDSKLVKLARRNGSSLITNDFNLKGVAEIQAVPVLNVNELSHALRPAVLPGERILVHIIKAGKEKQQGVGYLDDGTMVVVEEGRELIGKTVELEITSSLQTPAGRMIFGKVLDKD